MTVHHHTQTFNHTVLIGVVISFGVSTLSAGQISGWQAGREEIESESELSRSLEADRLVITELCAYKDCTIEELRDGRITLQEAASRFAAANSGWPHVQRHVRTQFPGGSELECEARCAVFLACDSAQKFFRRFMLYCHLAAEFSTLFPGTRPPTLKVQIPAGPETN